MHTTHLLYLHGFRSSPQSAKARLMAQHVAQYHPGLAWCCPQLPPSPREAMELVSGLTAQWPTGSMAVVGSSLGGFYATWVAEQRGCRAVLLNPAVDPARDLAQYIGQQTQFHAPEQQFYFRPEYVDELRALHCGPLRQAARHFCLIARGDEVLDWREMRARYAAARILLLAGSDHAISEFPSHLDAVMEHLARP